jgi:hypothetical protein
MSIQSEITRITGARDSSFTAVTNKGVTVPTGSTIDDLPSLIGQIQTGGGTSLNFTIVGGTSQPSSPTENTIWVNTSVTVTGAVIRPDEPTSPSEGMVWIKTADTGDCDLNVLSNGAITVRIGSVCIYHSGTWVGVDAQIYQSSSWEPVSTWSYKEGDEFLDATNGWKVVNRGGGNGAKQDARIYLSYTGSSNRDSNAYTVDRVDVTDFHTLHVDCDVTVNSSTWHVGLNSNNTDTYGTTNYVSYSEFNTTRARGVIHHDISSIRGKYYLRIHAGVARGYIYNVWLT